MVGLDGDEAGLDAASRVAHTVLGQSDLDVRFLRMPQGHDPASWLQSAGEPRSLIAVDQQAGPAEFLVGRILERHRSAEHPEWVESQVATVREAAQVLAQLPISDAASLAAHVATELDFPSSTVSAEIVNAKAQARTAPRRLYDRARVIADRDAAHRTSRPNAARRGASPIDSEMGECRRSRSLSRPDAAARPSLKR